MKAPFLLLLFALTISLARAQDSTRIKSRFLYAATAGTGFTFSTPSTMPFVFKAAGYYQAGRRFYAGAGSGYSLFSRTSLIPLYGSIRYHFRENRQWVPYAECLAGYSFAPSRNANGGFLLSPSAGISFSVKKNYRIQAALSYEWQSLERLKSHRDDHFTYEFKELLRHQALLFSLGFVW